VTTGTKTWSALRPGAAWDASASRSAAVLAVYFQYEARAARRRVSRTASALALLTVAAESPFRLVDAISFVTVLIALATTVAGAAVIEWRAEKELDALAPRNSR
jgi:hypothetical protein